MCRSLLCLKRCEADLQTLQPGKKGLGNIGTIKWSLNMVTPLNVAKGEVCLERGWCSITPRLISSCWCAGWKNDKEPVYEDRVGVYDHIYKLCKGCAGVAISTTVAIMYFKIMNEATHWLHHPNFQQDTSGQVGSRLNHNPSWTSMEGASTYPFRSIDYYYRSASHLFSIQSKQILV